MALASCVYGVLPEQAFTHVFPMGFNDAERTVLHAFADRAKGMFVIDGITDELDVVPLVNGETITNAGNKHNVQVDVPLLPPDFKALYEMAEVIMGPNTVSPRIPLPLTEAVHLYENALRRYKALEAVLREPLQAFTKGGDRIAAEQRKIQLRGAGYISLGDEEEIHEFEARGVLDKLEGISGFHQSEIALIRSMVRAAVAQRLAGVYPSKSVLQRRLSEVPGLIARA